MLIDAPLPRRARMALTALRMVPALMMVIHGSYRVADRGVAGFGQYLLEQHVPL